jgi:hypothetical protein
MFQIISGTSKTVSGTQNVERNVPNTAHKNVPTNSLLLRTLFLLVFPRDWIGYHIIVQLVGMPGVEDDEIHPLVAGWINIVEDPSDFHPD